MLPLTYIYPSSPIPHPLQAPPSVKKWGVVIPCLATAAANVSNLVFTRLDEALTGSIVSDKQVSAVCAAVVAAHVAREVSYSLPPPLLPRYRRERSTAKAGLQA